MFDVKCIYREKKKALNHLCFYFRKLKKNKLNLSYVDENNKNLGKKNDSKSGNQQRKMNKTKS